MSNTKVILKGVRLSYVNLLEPRAIEEGQTPKYSVSVIIKKDDTENIKKVKAAIKAAAALGPSKKTPITFPAKWEDSNKFKYPLKDGDVDRDEDEAYENCLFIGANSANKPGLVKPGPIVDGKTTMVQITEEADIYSGCYGWVSINFYPFNKAGNKGVAAGLNNVMKTADGENLGGSSAKAADDFSDFEQSDMDVDLDDDLL